MNEVCIVCKEELDSYGDCLCTRGRHGMRDGLKWLKVADVFDDHEGERLASLIKLINTPLKKLDTKIANHPQMAATVAALYAKYARKVQQLNVRKEMEYHSAYLDARRRYDNVKGTKKERPLKVFEYEIKSEPAYHKLLDDLGKATVARDFLGNLMKILTTRGDSLNKMSDDRRLMTRIDASSRDY